MSFPSPPREYNTGAPLCEKDRKKERKVFPRILEIALEALSLKTPSSHLNLLSPVFSTLLCFALLPFFCSVFTLSFFFFFELNRGPEEGVDFLMATETETAAATMSLAKELVLKAKDKELSVEDKDALKLEAALGHKQALSRGFGLFSLTSLGIVIAK